MSTMSVFAFERQAMQQAGPFRQMHVKTNGQFNYAVMWNVSSVHAIAAYSRPDTEIALNLSEVVNNPAVTTLVDNQFANAPHHDHVQNPVRTGPLRTSYKTWSDALAEPSMHVLNSHGASELIDTISIDFHCNTDAVLSALNGTITFYVWFSLDGHKPTCRVDGWSVPVWDEEPLRPDWGAAGQVSKGISDMLSGAANAFQAYLTIKLNDFAGDRAYSDIYTLPGTGITVGAPSSDDADKNVALCLVPAVGIGGLIAHFTPIPLS